MKPFSIYLHIPFCYHKCPYCDFNTYAVAQLPERDYTSALLSELDYRATLPEWRGRTVQTIFFGGGTPSLFHPSAIRRIIGAISQSFPVEEMVEVSLEANPGTVSAESLAGYREAGVNRLSLGAQSFQRETLHALGRMHAPEQIEAAFAAARGVGFANISLDLMYGAPKQSLSDLKADLADAVGLEPNHISAYGLTIEKGTPFFISYKKGLLKLPKEESLINMINEVNVFLAHTGYERYEISNFAQPGKEARHNMAYWNAADYLGLGAGAHSFCSERRFTGAPFGTRWSNLALPARYIKEAVAKGQAESWQEGLGRKEAMFEFFFLGLRKIAGANCAEFKTRFEAPVEEIYANLLEVLIDQKLLARTGDYLKLTERGLLLADSVIENFAQPENSAPIAVNA